MTSLNTMLGKISVSMMVLLVAVAASLIGMSSVYRYIEGQAPPAKIPQQLSGGGKVQLVKMFDSSAGKACTAGLQLGQGPNSLGLKTGT